MIDGKLLNDIAMHKAVKTVKLYRKLCNSYGIPCNRIIGVATAAVRKAENREQFLRLLTSSTDINFRLLSGEEEASYAFKATIYSLNIHEGIIVDIGGGSTEIISFRNNSIINSISIPIGSVVATETFLGKDSIAPDCLAHLEDYVGKMLKEQSWLWQEKSRTLIGLGGIIRNLGKIHRKRIEYPINYAHNYEMSIDDFNTIYEELASLDLKSRRKVKGLSSKRADIIVGGLAILKAIISICSPSHIVTSGFGLREGILFDYIAGTNPRVKFKDALSFSLRNFMELYGIRKNHAKHVCFLALSMFDQLKPLHNYGDDVRKLLEVASLLHDIGISISYYEHHRHSFYIILNSRLTGLNHRETLLTAAIAASHSDDNFKEDWQRRYEKILLPEDIELWEKLSVFLKLAECLDRSEMAVIKSLECQVLGDTVKIQTIRDGDAELEISLANEHSNTFRKAFGKSLSVT
ncbi:Ppx/GppA phosphatase family protein [Acetivibrio straminisolvens]|uniref:Exopolyphosphatase n=2 Tax=Acetivibrio straminisolvens TaxID=253314 RepID=W4V3A0_9FIRM|nr:Ppx/GppA phosphatase family protein [Acetivibrio straminisolvens]GAE87313.1 exopolyphosphatase [Acetivibrio straminisolvens JCM 21531]